MHQILRGQRCTSCTVSRTIAIRCVRHNSTASGQAKATFKAGEVPSSPAQRERGARFYDSQHNPLPKGVPPGRHWPGRNVRPSKDRLLRKLRAQPLDYSESDPVKAIHRLDVVSEPTSKFADYKELFKLPAYSVFEHSPKELKKLDAHANDLNAAVHNVYNGTQRRNWEQAWTKGFAVLHAQGQERLAKLDVKTLEILLKMSLKLSPEELEKHWDIICKSLLYHLALKECDLASREMPTSVLANWACMEINSNTGGSIERVVEFWEHFTDRIALDPSRPRNPDAYTGGLMHLDVPRSLFSAALLAHFLAHEMSLRDFIETIAGNIAVPEGYDAPFDQARLMESLAHIREDKSAEPWRRDWQLDSYQVEAAQNLGVVIAANGERLGFWFEQMELVRMWSRAAESGLCTLCRKWRDRNNQRALHESWKMIKGALDPPKEWEDDKWMEIDWPERAPKVQSKKAADPTLPEAMEEQASSIADRLNESMGLVSLAAPDEEDGKSQRARKRAQIPALFTPEVASEYLRSFMQLKMESSAEDLWTFVEDELSLPPSLSMWTAVLLAQSRQGDVEKVQETIRKMQNAGIAPDAVCWSIAVTACFRAGRMDAGMETMKQLFSDKTLRTRFPDGKLPVHIYNVIINSLFYNDLPEPALEMLAKMLKDDVHPDIYTVNIILRYYSRAKSHNLQAISKHLQLVEEYQLMPDIVTFTTILDALMRAGRQDAIERVRHIMTSMGVKPNAVTYGALVDYLIKSSVESGQEDGIRAALELLYQMQNSNFKDGIKPSENLYTAIVQGLARFSVRHDSSQHLDMAEQIHYEMTRAKIHPNRITYNSLMTANLSHHRTDRAIEHLDSYRAMKTRKQISDSSSASIADGRKILSDNVPIRMWQALLAGLLARGQHARARAVVEEMREIGIDFNSGALQKMRDTAYEMKGE